MTDPATPPQPSIPPDDPHRHLTVARPDEDELFLTSALSATPTRSW